MKDRSDVERYYAHLRECAACGGWDLCQYGMELMTECFDDLDGEELEFALKAIDRDNIRKEAEANFRFYANSEEP